MLTVKVNDTENFEVNLTAKEVLINGSPVQADWISTGKNKFHILVNNRSYNIELTGNDDNKKLVTVMVNGVKHRVEITNEHDALLHQLGLDKLVAGKVNDVKAPMPGLVLAIMVKEGSEVKKGDALIVLEAMKMENVIKAMNDGVVKKINVSTKMAVEKNQVLLIME